MRLASVLTPSLGLLQMFRSNAVASKYEPVLHIMDEGMNSYFSSSVWTSLVRAAYPRTASLVSRFVQLPMNAILGLSYRYLDTAVLRYLNTEHFLLFSKGEDRLIPNASVASAYKYFIEKRGAVFKRAENPRQLAILVTQPFSEDLGVPVTHELSVTRTIVDAVTDAGFDLVLKPHPRESRDKYAPVLADVNPERARLDATGVPVESLYHPLQPDCVIGYTSTALVVAAAISGIPTVTIVDILLEAVPELNEELVRKSQAWLSPRYQADAAQWGEQDPQVWKAYSAWMVENGILAESFQSENAFTNEYLPGSQ